MSRVAGIGVVCSLLIGAGRVSAGAGVQQSMSASTASQPAPTANSRRASVSLQPAVTPRSTKQSSAAQPSSPVQPKRSAKATATAANKTILSAGGERDTRNPPGDAVPWRAASPEHANPLRAAPGAGPSQTQNATSNKARVTSVPNTGRLRLFRAAEKPTGSPTASISKLPSKVSSPVPVTRLGEPSDADTRAIQVAKAPLFPAGAKMFAAEPPVRVMRYADLAAGAAVVPLVRPGAMAAPAPDNATVPDRAAAPSDQGLPTNRPAAIPQLPAGTKLPQAPIMLDPAE